MNSGHRNARSQVGASYVEVLIAAILIIVALVPMTETLRGAGESAHIQQQATTRHFRLTARLEELLAEPFVALEAAATAAGSSTVPTAYSDPVGTGDRRLVFLALYDADDEDADGDPFTGADAGLMWVRVEIEDTALAMESLYAQ